MLLFACYLFFYYYYYFAFVLFSICLVFVSYICFVFDICFLYLFSYLIFVFIFCALLFFSLILSHIILLLFACYLFLFPSFFIIIFFQVLSCLMEYSFRGRPLCWTLFRVRSTLEPFLNGSFLLSTPLLFFLTLRERKWVVIPRIISLPFFQLQV